MRKSVETSPFFTLASAAPSASCELRYDDGLAQLDYRFSDGAWLHAERDDGIEYSDLELHLAKPGLADALGLLKRAEQTAFSGQGCGIDWQQAEAEATAQGGSDLIYRGQACNCQARVHRDQGGRAIGLLVRSSC